MRVLIVEDQKMMADAVGEGLRDTGLAVDVVYDGSAALDRCGANRYDVVVLDRGLPVVHGDDVCRTIVAEHPGTRILMLTAAAEVTDRIFGLELGADDYLPKPFVFAELVARVRTLGRRSRLAVPPVLRRAGVVLDPRGTGCSAPISRFRSPRRSSPCSKNCSARTARWSRRKSCWKPCGTRTSIRSPTSSA